MSSELTLVQTIAVWALPVLFAVTLHEVAHGYVARLLGDNTAQMMGRLTLNPLRHIDPVGTVLVPGVLLVMSSLFGGGFLFGWAKPVPVNQKNLRNPRPHMSVVAVAGPMSNLVMAVGWGLLLRWTLGAGDEGWVLGLRYMAAAGIQINLILMVLNLLPIPPLDGGRVVSGLLPPGAAFRYDKIEPYGLFIIVALLATQLLQKILLLPLAFSMYGLSQLLGIPMNQMF